MIIKPRIKDPMVHMKPDLKIRKKKRKFCKEATVFAKIYDDTKEEDWMKACDMDFRNC